MQNMHKTTLDGPLTGVHLPDHGSRAQPSGPISKTELENLDPKLCILNWNLLGNI